MRHPTKALGLGLCALSIATGTLFGCGMFDTQTASPEVELMSILKADNGSDILAGLEASYCGAQRCAIAVPVGWSGAPSGLGIGPLGEEPSVGMPCPNLPSAPIGFSAVTCRTESAEVGLALCLQTTFNKDSAIWGPCAASAEALGRPLYLEAFMMLARPLSQLVARKPAATPPPAATLVTGGWPAGPAKVCVAVAPNRGVEVFGFSVTTRGGVAPTSTQAPGGATSTPLCVDVTIPQGTSTLQVRTTGSAAGAAAPSCLHAFTSPDDNKSVPACTGAFAANNGAVVAVAADTASRFEPVYQQMVNWLNARAR